MEERDTTTNTSRLLQNVQAAFATSTAAQKMPHGRVRLQVNFSVPRQARELYPYAHVDGIDVSKTARSHSVEAYVEQVFMTASYAAINEDGSEGEERLIYALECFLYTLPKHRSAVLYVSKLDSSGWAPKLPEKHLQPFLDSSRPKSNTVSSTSSALPMESSASITRVITEAFIRHFASLDHWVADERLARVQHLSLHILARAQGAYLFPSSNENKSKHILSDGQLIKWWRRVVSSVTQATRTTGLDTKQYYLIPGYDRLESHHLIALPEATSGWVYGHPYSQKGAGLSEKESLPPLPLSGPTFGRGGDYRPPLLNPQHIATLLPHFPDDPKSRFIAELARDAHEHAAEQQPAKRRIVPPSHVSVLVATDASLQHISRHSTPPSRRSATPSTPPRPSTPLAGAARRANSRSGTSSPSPVKLTSSQRQSMRERFALDQVTADEFWARMAFRQECCSGNAVGVFVALFTRFSDVPALLHSGADMLRSASNTSTTVGAGSGTTGRSMPGQPLALPYQMLQDIIFKRMMIDACDWSKAQASVELTRNWQQAIGQALQRKGNIRVALGEERGEKEAQMQDTRLVGEGIIWCAVDTVGPTKADVIAAEEAFKAQGGHDSSTDAVAAEPVQAVNMLTVKRKRKT